MGKFWTILKSNVFILLSIAFGLYNFLQGISVEISILAIVVAVIGVLRKEEIFLCRLSLTISIIAMTLCQLGGFAVDVSSISSSIDHLADQLSSALIK